MSAKTSEYTDICIAADVRADMLPAAPLPPSGSTGHCPGAPIAQVSWSSARFECLYTLVLVGWLSLTDCQPESESLCRRQTCLENFSTTGTT